MGIVSMTGLNWLCYVVAWREYFFERIKQNYPLLGRIAHILILMGFEYWCLYISYGDCWLGAKYIPPITSMPYLGIRSEPADHDHNFCASEILTSYGEKLVTVETGISIWLRRYKLRRLALQRCGIR